MELTRFETREKREAQRTAHILEVMRRRQIRLYPPGATLRDAHTKKHALVEARFTVEPDLPAELAVGVFARPASYDAWVRFSAASDTPSPDRTADMQGAAIKLRGVPGQRIAESDEETTQDFLLINVPAMPLGTVALFHAAIWLVTDFHAIAFGLWMLLTGRLGVLKGLSKAKARPSSPADLRYWSATPYLFGPDQVAKYSLVPTSPLRSQVPEPAGDDYVGDNLASHLARGPATFDFMVQLRTDPAAMPVEDAAVVWDEERAPFRKVATLTVPEQAFRTAERDALAEALSFSPAHALVEHRPVGGVNRARMAVYAAQAPFRMARDGRTRVT